MRIVFAASECAPWAKTGGLGEVTGALSREIAALGHEVAVYMPYYRQVRERAPEKHYAIRSVTIPFRFYNRFAAILDGGVHNGVKVYFVDCPELFDREAIYATAAGAYRDNWERFGLLSRAVLESAKQLGTPDVFHVHDWQTALLPVYLRTLYAGDAALRNAGTLLTIHNAGYQGVFPAQTLEKLLFPPELFTMDRLEYYGQVNFLKGGIEYADMLATVSRKYAEEIQTPEFGNGIHGVLRQRAADLRGILNGVDYTEWNPATDGNIAAHYTTENLAGKAECRRDLLHAFGCQPVGETTAVLGLVTRLATQKGVDLMEKIAEPLGHEDAVVVALGDGEAYYENLFRSLAERSGGKIHARTVYDETLAHKVHAGADMLLMPSRYEPCGLGQMHSMKYGTVPVVRATGGLDDTVEEWNAEMQSGTGFKFERYDAGDFLAAIERGLGAFRDRGAWQKLMRNCMAQDYSWARSAKEYAELYTEVARGRLARQEEQAQG